jgi:hypothetical protein
MQLNINKKEIIFMHEAIAPDLMIDQITGNKITYRPIDKKDFVVITEQQKQQLHEAVDHVFIDTLQNLLTSTVSTTDIDEINLSTDILMSQLTNDLTYTFGEASED